jgi:hypothetical protein
MFALAFTPRPARAVCEPLAPRKLAISGAFLARPERFELPTFGSVDRRSIQLSYGRLHADSNPVPVRALTAEKRASA